MHVFFEAIWPSLATPRSHCAATEVDVVGLSAIALLEWMGEPAQDCVDADQQSH